MSRSRSISQTNSKSNSSSILSSEELSPFRPAVVDSDDVVFSSFAAKLSIHTGYWIQKDRHFILHQASCIWRCKRVGTRKVIHLEIDIYLAY
ncbi:uncharacterized protein LOC110885321 isoform X2 [Helianthus annuus]|nr:uncharacterized protein LOC110885321 isoform X2 [Helianthus annuus]